MNLQTLVVLAFTHKGTVIGQSNNMRGLNVELFL